MTVIFRDVYDGLSMTRAKLDGLDFNELMYADDTALLTSSVHAMNRLIAKIGKCAGYHGLNFNKNKCVSTNFHVEGVSKYADGTKVPTADTATYLGGELSRAGSVRTQLSTKIGSCFGVLKNCNSSGTTHSVQPNSKFLYTTPLYVQNSCMD